MEEQMETKTMVLKCILKFGLGIILIIAYLELSNTHYSKHILLSDDIFLLNNVTALMVLFNLVIGVTKRNKLLFVKKILQLGLSIILGANILFWIYRLLIFFSWAEFFYCLFFTNCSLHIFIWVDGLFSPTSP